MSCLGKFRLPEQVIGGNVPMIRLPEQVIGGNVISPDA